jgi:hypothetical protein
MEKFNGKLGAGSFSSEKPVILFDDFNGSYRDFDTVAEAVESREKESQNNQWANFKMIFLFNSEKSEYEIQ